MILHLNPCLPVCVCVCVCVSSLLRRRRMNLFVIARSNANSHRVTLIRVKTRYVSNDASCPYLSPKWLP